jgi:hypothetical protein
MSSAYIPTDSQRVRKQQLSKPGKRISAVRSRDDAEQGPTLGEVKALLLQYSVSRIGSVDEINAKNLREAYELICALARKYDVDPEKALRQYRAMTETRTKLVGRAPASTTHEPLH